MSRPLRIDYPGTFYHVMSRGNEQRAIFYDEFDYKKFLEFLGETTEKFHLEVHAYVLMSNHYHLLVKTQQSNLSRSIQWLGVSYAGWFNRQHKRSGHLFQGRFKSFLIENERYFAAMGYYIHGNPVRARLVKNSAEYVWSSNRAYADKGAAPRWLVTDIILGISGGRRKFCLEQEAYLLKSESPLAELRYGLYLGKEGYAKECQERARGESGTEKPQMRLLLRTIDKRKAAEDILRKLGSPGIEEQFSGGKRKRPLRDICIYIMSKSGIFTHKEIGEVFSVGYTAVTGTIIRAERHLKEDKHLRSLVERIIEEG
jgi:putative transposase